MRITELVQGQVSGSGSWPWSG